MTANLVYKKHFFELHKNQVRSANSLILTLVLLNPDISYLYKQCRSRSVGFWRSQLSEEAIWSGSALFAIKYVILYQQPRSSNLIGWKLEVGVASYFIQHDNG